MLKILIALALFLNNQILISFDNNGLKNTLNSTKIEAKNQCVEFKNHIDTSQHHEC